MLWLAKYASLVTRWKTVTMSVVVTRDSIVGFSRTSWTNTANAVPSAAIREFTHSRGRSPTDNEVAARCFFSRGLGIVAGRDE
jgi:hypothetical protein